MLIADPKTIAERRKVALEFASQFKFPIPILVDTLDDQVEKAYAGWPDRIYIIDADGRIAYKGQPGPRGFLPAEAADSLQTLLSAERVDYYLGEVRMKLEDGGNAGTTLALIKRTQNQGKGQITETVLTVDDRRGTKEFTTLMKVTGSRFALSEAMGALTGSGELMGEPWKWTAWRYTAVLADNQGSVEGDDVLGPQGVLTVRKRLLGPDGKVRFTFMEEHRPITRASYELLRERLLKPAPAGPQGR